MPKGRGIPEHLMSDFDRLKETFSEIGVEIEIGTVDDFSVRWYGYPDTWNGNPRIRAVGTEFVFDDDGRFLGAGMGDEQTSVDYRV